MFTGVFLSKVIRAEDNGRQAELLQGQKQSKISILDRGQNLADISEPRVSHLEEN